MDLDGIAAMITAAVAAVIALGSGIAGGYKLWRSAVTRAATELQAKKTVAALEARVEELEGENQSLWKLLDGVTS